MCHPEIFSLMFGRHQCANFSCAWGNLSLNALPYYVLGNKMLGTKILAFWAKMQLRQCKKEHFIEEREIEIDRDR